MKRLTHRGLMGVMALAWLLLFSSPTRAEAEQPGRLRVAAICTAYYQNSHADVIVSRLLETDTLDGRGRPSSLKLVSLYTDQVPATDKSRTLATKYHVPIYKTVREALTLGGDSLAVDGVLLIAEHGDYPRSKTGEIVYPKRRLFEQIIAEFAASRRSVPVYIDKHLADNWDDAKSIYDVAAVHRVPLMAGSSVPLTWRRPPANVRAGAHLAEVVVLSYHTLDAYGFHALETLQALVERRRGGETGIQAVECLTGDAVWKAQADGAFDNALLTEALARLDHPPTKPLKEIVAEPVLFKVQYTDGLKASVLTLNGAVSQWSGAWRYAADDAQAGKTESTLFFTQEARPFMHFASLVRGIELFTASGHAPWPVERTLMTSGLLDAELRSKLVGKPLQTPELQFPYEVKWTWTQPSPPPPDRPLSGQ